MKKLIILAVAVVFSGSSMAQSKPKGKRTLVKKEKSEAKAVSVTTPVLNSGSPSLDMPVTDVKVLQQGFTFDNTTLDYGSIANASDGNRVFKFKNNTKETLLIKGANASCGCTTPNVPKDPIKPGQSSEIKVHYDTKRTGPFTKSITVNVENLEGTAKMQQMLTIKGTVAAPESDSQAVPTQAPTPIHNSHDGHGH